MFLHHACLDTKVFLRCETELNLVQKAVIAKTFWKEVLSGISSRSENESDPPLSLIQIKILYKFSTSLDSAWIAPYPGITVSLFLQLRPFHFI